MLGHDKKSKYNACFAACQNKKNVKFGKKKVFF